MGFRLRQLAYGATALAPLTLASTGALGQTFTIVSVTASGSIGELVASPSATTTLSLAASGGAITVSTGGFHVGSSTDLYTVTVKCSGPTCKTTTPKIWLANTGTPAGCLGAVSAFSEAAGSETPGTVSGTQPSINFTLSPDLTNGGTGTFYVGLTAPLKATSACTTGPASTAFMVSIGKTSATQSSASTVAATVLRPIAVANTAGMRFGSIVKPASGSGSVTLTSGGALTTTAGSIVPTSTHGAAGFSVTGEGHQAFTLTVPSTFVMTAGTKSLLVTTSSSATGTQSLSSSIGSAGSLAFTVGGAFPISTATSSGAYTGSLVVTVAYN
jgi:hypothetical protein